ncbi:MAG: preprotein translocase subunit SecE [Planctomycetes bacterium]|nr:preprotein translocase subunit SecE [Planctomycetota bacterium]MBM4057350.1 preprotein translocase subunit SecE [Planctomycetota bacterium]
MAGIQESASSGGAVWREMLSAARYKPHQGRIARRATFGALVAILLLAAFRLSQALSAWYGGTVSLGSASGALGADGGADYGLVRILIPLALLAIGSWLAFRMVNVPRFAEFLIAVEGEMAKVSWPSTGEVVRSSVVIIFMIFALTAILFLYDLFWRLLLRFLQEGVG